MSSNEPIVQRVEVDAEDAVRGLQEVGKESAQLGEQSKRLNDLSNQSVQADRERAQQTEKLENALRELLRQEQLYQRTLSSGADAAQQDNDASQGRRAEINRLSRDLAKLEDEEEKLNQELRTSVDSHREASGGADLLGGAVRGAAGAVSVLTGGILGSGGLLTALGKLSEDLDKSIEKAREFQEAYLNLQFLGDTFNPQEKEFVGKAAVFGGRQPAEVATALSEIKSFFPGKSDKDVQTLALEVLELGITTPASLESLANPFAALIASGQSPQEAQNTLRATIQQGGVSDPSVVGGLLGEVLASGQKIGGLSAAESAGLVAGATGLDKRNPSVQITGLTAILRSLLGDKTKEQQALIDSAGIDTTNLLTSLESLGVAVEQGRIDNAGIDRLVGAEGLTTAASLGDPTKRSDFLEKVRRVVEAAQSQRDLTADAINNQFSADPATSLNFAIKQQEAADAVARANDAGALASDLAVKVLDNELRDAGVGPIRRFIARNTAASLSAVGVEAEYAAALGGEFSTRLGGGSLEETIATGRAAGKVGLARRGYVTEQPFNDGAGDQAQPTTIIQNQIVNNGTQFNAAGDRRTDDLDGRARE